MKNGGSTYHKLIHSELGETSTNALIRLKSRGLIVPRRESSGYYKYDITEFGFKVINAKSEFDSKSSSEMPFKI